MKNLITVLTLALLAFFCLTSCQKDDQTQPDVDEPVVREYSNKVVLQNLSVSADNSAKLTWSKLDTSAFREYLIVRKESKDDIIDVSHPFYYPSQVIKRISDPNTTSFTDLDIPYTPYLEYQVIAVLGTSNSISKNIYSNSKTYERPGIKVFKAQPYDVLPDLSNNRLYIIESDSGKISIYNFESGAVEKSISTNAKIGFSDFGTFNNKRELYVPRNDGWVYVYDAATLQKIDQVNCGSDASCVVFNNNKLFVSTDDDYWPNRPLKVIDRATKAVITTAGDNDRTRMKLIPGTTSEFIDISLYIGPTDLGYLKFDANGNKVTQFEDRYHGDYPLDAIAFQIMPNGLEFITSDEGAIYSKDLTYKLRLPHGNYRYSDFAFSSTGSTIYAACSNNKLVISYTSPGYVETKKYSTKGYPYKVFRKDNTLICLSSSSPLGSYSPYNFISAKLFIEKIAL